MKICTALFAGVFALVAFLPPAAAADKYLPSVETNAPPKEAFASFDKIEFADIVLRPPFAGQKPNEAAREKIQANFTSRVAPMAVALNARPARHDPPRVLLVEPAIEKIKYISTGARIWAGPMAGSSQVLMKLKISDKATGEIIAEPEFYQHANAWGAAYSRNDQDMLSRITDLVTSYFSSNIETAVGGRTGAEGLKN